MWTIIRAFLGPIGTWLAGIGIIATVIGGIYTKGHMDGTASMKAKWNAAIIESERTANEARAKANASVPLNPTTRQLCDSEWNREPC